MIVGEVGGVHGLGQDQEQTMYGKEEEVEEQQSPQKEEVGEHPRSETCAQPLYRGVPQRQRAEEREAAEETVMPSLRQKETSVTESSELHESTGVDRFGLTFETTTLRRLQHGISLVNSDVAGTSLKACFLEIRQGKRVLSLPVS